MKTNIKNQSGIALGLLFGVIVGIGLDNIGLGICFGLAIGAAIDQTKKKQSDDEAF